MCILMECTIFIKYIQSFSWYSSPTEHFDSSKFEPYVDASLLWILTEQMSQQFIVFSKPRVWESKVEYSRENGHSCASITTTITGNWSNRCMHLSWAQSYSSLKLWTGKKWASNIFSLRYVVSVVASHFFAFLISPVGWDGFTCNSSQNMLQWHTLNENMQFEQ